ncbi:unnamed protein product [Rhizoctonia solani]|uniref:Uncharacterized protein n=1 Tax=Rhizoctonia solani TaxID=456999 RepID=A0A8H3AWK6_9AGAM|nr:unnamed protein product [Rhizoctonia solani]
MTVGDDFPTLPGDAGVLETDAAFGLDPHSGDTHTAIESDSESIAINFSSQADPLDYSTLTFSPPHGPKTFLAKGSVADIWMVDHTSACAPHGTAYVSKLLRVSTSDFDNYSMLYEYRTAQVSEIY